MSRSNQQTIGAIIKSMLKKQNLKGKLEELDVLNYCEEALGVNLMKYITNISIDKETLFINVKSAAVRNELSYQKSKLIEKINEKTGKKFIKKIILG